MEPNKIELRLSITTIGKLLLESCISQKNTAEKDIIKDVELCIPVYQRPYKWTVKNVYQLLDDIEEARHQNKETYRVGTLILHHNDKIYDIVDGQQRIISFCLILKIFSELLGKVSPDEFLKQEIEENKYTLHNLLNNYRALKRKIGNIPDKDKGDLYEYITDQCELIVVITNNLSEAFQFFDSQNSRGKKLYPHDLLKAYHLREMNDLDATVIEKTVKEWEEMNQAELSALFSGYLYRLKKWIKGSRADDFTEHNISCFKGISRRDNYSYAQFYKGAFAYAEMVNHSSMPFVSGMHDFIPFQIATPIIAGEPFFKYAKHYFGILKDIQNNDKYEGYYINGNEIVKTLDLRNWKNGVGNRIARLLFDTAILLYIDRFCPEKPSKTDSEMLDQFVVYAFIWAYSLRAQYRNLGWVSAQNYILGYGNSRNRLNIYKIIAEEDSPSSLHGKLADSLSALSVREIYSLPKNIDEKDADDVYLHYLYYFKKNKFIEGIK